MKSSECFIPVYFRLAENIKQQVLSGALKPGDPIPSEAQLCEQYGISRMTVRQGLKLLAEEGLIESFRGKGSFVTYPKFNELVIELPDSEFSSKKGVNTRLISVDVIPADTEIASILKLRIGSKVIKSKKVFSKEDGPFAIDTRYMVYQKGEPMVEQGINYSDFPKFVSLHTGLVSVRNQVTFSAVLSDKEIVGELSMEQGKPLLKIEQLVFGIKEQPLGWSVIFCNAEKYKMEGYTKTFF